MVTKKDFKAIAEIIRKHTIRAGHPDPFLVRTAKDIARIYATNLADYFATQNPRFDRQKFLNACGL